MFLNESMDPKIVILLSTIYLGLKVCLHHLVNLQVKENHLFCKTLIDLVARTPVVSTMKSTRLTL